MSLITSIVFLTILILIWLNSDLQDKSEDNEYTEYNDDNFVEALSNQFMSHKEKQEHLKSIYWCKLKDKRNLLYAHDKCESCNTKSNNLEAHHLNYKTLGCERVEDIVLLCRKCHQRQHDHYGYDRITDYSKII